MYPNCQGHGYCRYKFNGRGNTLGHAFNPINDNCREIHFVKAEEWNYNSTDNFYAVALHEVGHALGLSHSSDPSAVMYAYYSRITNFFNDDILGIQSVYGAPKLTTTTTPT